MSAAVLALGTGAVTVSGCVWYVPAVADLRAGADRPVSRRLAAAGCVAGWSAAAAVTALLLLGAPAGLVLGPAAAGASASVLLRVRAALRLRRERAEDARCWSALAAVPPPARPAPQRVFVRRAAAGLLSAAGAALALLTWGPSAGAGGLFALAVPTLLAGAALAVAWAAAARGRTARDPVRTAGPGGARARGQ
ncbi:hypothetical protein [Streptomyces termitum]|uniref:hypothetical protein n=1 Tax=Streptomyces termitum TaxID=67368 RepID=UPI0037A3958C